MNQIKLNIEITKNFSSKKQKAIQMVKVEIFLNDLLCSYNDFRLSSEAIRKPKWARFLQLIVVTVDEVS